MEKTDYMNVVKLVVDKLEELQSRSFEEFNIEEWEVYSELPSILINDVE